MIPNDQHKLIEMEQTMHELRLALSASNGQCSRARDLADALALALRRCCDDSKDLLARREPDMEWVSANIKLAEEALDLHEEKEW